ncbi:hypothetical protein [Methanococcus aeolicus]|uniref:hypothetical protein n=1 Tax=Methanococcus aeolicus TaxID=42879 RepID=UPI0021C95CB7|nr:hypothetical protein [Methanococcus aeolicus]UXM85126.1 hypothetical protein N6C89_02270 [Methanococcus aeolicus]
MVAKTKLIPYVLQINEFSVKKLGLTLNNLSVFVEEFLNQYTLKDDKKGEYLSCCVIVKENIIFRN